MKGQVFSSIQVFSYVFICSLVLDNGFHQQDTNFWLVLFFVFLIQYMQKVKADEKS